VCLELVAPPSSHAAAIDLAARGASLASGEATGPIPGNDELAEPIGDLVRAATLVEQVPGQRVRNHPLKRDGDVRVGEKVVHHLCRGGAGADKVHRARCILRA
jgi:hypothetical protein